MPNPRGPRPWPERETTASSPPSSKSLPEAARLARRGEDIAAAYLKSRGLEILARNWRAGHRELDIVVLDGRVVAFVEVKARRGGPQHPLEAITRAKRRDVRTLRFSERHSSLVGCVPISPVLRLNVMDCHRQ